MNTYAQSFSLFRVLNAAVMMVTLVAMSFPISAFAEEVPLETPPVVETPAPAVVPPTCEDGFVLDEAGDECVEEAVPEVLGALKVQYDDEDDNDEDEDKINICHETGSQNNPWQALQVAEEGWNGHGTHDDDYIYAGPVKENGKPNNKDGQADAWCEEYVPEEEPQDPPYEDTTKDGQCVVVSNTLTKEGADAAVLVSNPHPGWTAVFGSIAKWIWGEDPTTLVSGVAEIETFTREFSVLNTSTGATLDIAADNSYTVTVNGNVVGADAGEFNYTSGGQDSYTIPATNLLVGTNTLVFVVTNKDVSGETPSSNPAGLRYKLTVAGTDCGVPKIIKNTCVAPSTTGGTEDVAIGNAPGSEDELQEILNDEGYASVDADDDQNNTQQWNGTANTVSFTVKNISKKTNSGDTHVFGYFLNGSPTFVPVFRDGTVNAPHAGAALIAYGASTSTTISNVSSIVFATWDSNSNTYYATKQSLNGDKAPHAVVFNPEDNTYVIAFEDLPLIGDHDYNDVAVELTVTDCEAGNTTTIVATKIVCSDEKYLPNAMGSSHVTDKDTAADFLADVNEDRDVPVCWLQSDWQFEWGNQNAVDGGNATIGHVAGYTTSGLTDEDGTVTMSVPLKDVSQIRVRELLQEGYIPFTGTADTDTVSAELSCSNDGLHYDNWDYISKPEEGENYYCVAWNVEEPKAPVCDPKINLVGNGSFEAPDVTNGAGWDVFEVGTSPTLVWLADFLGAAPGGKVEIHGGVNGWLDSNLNGATGEQYAELDSDLVGPSGPGGESAVEIAQGLTTVSGQKYHVSYDFSARPGTNKEQNGVTVSVNGTPLQTTNASASTAGNQTEWSTYGFDFTAAGALTTLALRDAGTPNDSLGSFLDNVKVTCVPEEDEETGTLIIEKRSGEYDGVFEFSINPVVEEILLKTVNPTASVETEEGYGETEVELAEGEYDLKEIVPEGWTLDDVDCDYGDYDNDSFGLSIDDGYTIYIEEGDTVTCTFTNTKNKDTPPAPQCSDDVDNADSEDGLADANDPGCHTDGNAGNFDSYNPNDNDESNSTGDSETDVCNNIDGFQSTIPDGLVSNGDGGCVQSGGQSRSGSNSRNNGRSGGSVLGAATCGPLLSQYLHEGWASNDPSEVTKLQEFLNSHLGAGLPITGVFGPSTFEWVKTFQLKYGNDVLSPWVGLPASGITGPNTPTGYVYQTTRWQINNIWCPGSEAFPTVLD